MPASVPGPAVKTAWPLLLSEGRYILLPPSRNGQVSEEASVVSTPLLFLTSFANGPGGGGFVTYANSSWSLIEKHSPPTFSATFVKVTPSPRHNSKVLPLTKFKAT